VPRLTIDDLPVRTFLTVADVEAQQTARQIGRETRDELRTRLPAQSGRLRRGVQSRVQRTGEGYRVEVSPSSRVRYPSGVTAKEVGRFVERGTGVFGPVGRPIRPRRASGFALPGGFRTATLRGQRPQRVFETLQRTGESTLLVRLAEDGAQRAARAIEASV
jgi:hypothetical protein